MALVAAPAAAEAKKRGKKKSGVGGRVVVRVPAFDPETGTSLATGFVRARHGCDSPRVVRFAFFSPQGLPLNTGQPAVVTAPAGSFIAALPRPFLEEATVIVKTAVDARVIRSGGRRVKCRALRAKDIPVELRRSG
jgi:hypothetical protein